MHILRALGINDLRSIRRDSLLLYVLFIPILMVVLIRIFMPLAGDYFSAKFQIDIMEHVPLILSFFFILQIPVIFGLVFGFLILDERDERTLTVLKVTPMSMNTYVGYRLMSVFICTVIYITVLIPTTGIFDMQFFIGTILISLLSGLFSVFVLLVLPTFANNKVEGLALMKGLGILFLGPLAAYFLSSNWQYVFGLLPTFWPAKAFWLLWEGEAFLLPLLIGLGYFLVLNVWMFKKFIQKTT
ncbi:hypothetical protein LC040_00320 [Bacillus tianshenii]|nr:hypothetical protein LC040_00320 [Bacillus tianshenii]